MPRFLPGLLLVFLFSAEVSWAAESKEEAKSRFITGQSHYNLNEFAEALQEFKEAYRLYPDPVFLYNAGQCERQLNHYEEAIAFYRSFLRNQPKAPNRNEVKRKIEEMERALASKVSASPEVVSSTVDPSPVPQAVTAPATPSVTTNEPDLSTSRPTPPSLELAPVMPEPSEAKPSSTPRIVPATPQPSPATAGLDLNLPSPPTTPKKVYRQWWFWTATGVAVAAATTAILWSRSDEPAGPPVTALGGKKVF